MSLFHQILDVSKQQSAALARGDLDEAVRLLAERAPLVAAAGPAGKDDVDVIHEIMRRDRQLSGAIRERMIDLRNQSLKTQQGRHALSGYYTSVGGGLSRLVNATR
jgi:hypothetical protein